MASPIEVVTAVYRVTQDEEEVDLAAMISDPGWVRETSRYLHPGLEVRFVVPEASGVQVMERSEFEGLEGLQEGWQIWMQPWEQFRVRTEELVDIGDGRVLLLAHATAVMKGSGIEIEQEVAGLHTVRDGRITASWYYLDQQQARRDAGLA
ncbi:MAG: nuclear transport factor 2 family protein [Solirubrobacterales bacterium]